MKNKRVMSKNTLYPKNRAEQLDKELFQNPSPEYRGIPFWSWNCRITRERIDRQLDCFKEMGFGGVDIHPRTGLDTEYLGEEYMELIRYAVEKCKEKGLFCWLYDEDRFPSGNAGGKVTRNQRFRGRYLLLTEKREFLPLFCPDRETFEREIDAGGKPAGYFAAAYEITLHEGRLENYRRLYTKEEIGDALERGKRVRFGYVKLMEEENWFEDQSYVDTMNPEAIREFIRITHESYAKTVGEEFGTIIPAIFTDEPRMGKHALLSWSESDEDVTMPYTEYMAEQMKKKFGLDPLDIVPEYIWEPVDENNYVYRYYYRECATECFTEAFMDQISDWCGRHGIAMTGHVLSEDSLYSQTFALGECMRCYRKMDIPGIDILVDAREFATVKQAVSVAHQNGREAVASELYGVTQWDCSFKTYKLQGDWQAALGITVRIPHLSHMSLKGEAKRDWPASIFYQSPWYKEFSAVEDHFARLNTALTRGRAVVNIGVIHPVESMWRYFGPNDLTAGIREEIDRDFSEMIRWMLYGNLDFDFISEALLPQQYRQTDETGILQVGDMKYSAVLVPGLKSMRSTTRNILEKFAERGGKIIFMGEIPWIEDGKCSEDIRMLAEKCQIIPKSRAALYKALEEERIIEIMRDDGCRADTLFYQMREDGEVKWLFISHVMPQKKHLSSPENYMIIIRGEWDIELYQTLTGDIQELPVEKKDGNTIYRWEAYAEDSLLLRLRKSINFEYRQDCEMRAGKKEAGEECVSFVKPNAFYRHEYNVLLIDHAKVQLDEGKISREEELLRVDNRIRRKLGFVLRRERMNEPWFLQEKEHHKVRIYFEVLSEIDTEAYLALEDLEKCRITVNGQEADRTSVGFYVDRDIPYIKIPALTAGINRVTVECDYDQKSGLEYMYILGNFDVELRGIKSRIRKVGKEITVGDITGQGMPFYTGNLDYIFEIETDGKSEYAVHIPHFAAPVLGIYVDGEKKGIIAYAPHRQKLGILPEGKHELVIRMYGNRHNGFGTLHNADDDYVWYGPDSYRTQGDDWTECYRLRPAGLMSEIEVEKSN